MRASQLTAAFAAVAALVLTAAPALSGPADEAAARSWIAAIDASPYWRANVRDVTTDPATGETIVTRALIAGVPRSVEIRIPEMRLSGKVRLSDGRLSADSAHIDAATLRYRTRVVTVADLSARGFALPDIRDFRWDEDRPLTSLVGIYGLLADFRMKNGEIGELDLTEKAEGVASRIVYDDVTLSDWADGRIARFRTGPLRMESPDPDGIVRMSSSGFIATDIDLGAIHHALAPSAFRGGRGDGEWRPAVGRAVYDGFAVDAPGASITLGRVTTEKLRVRQAPESFVAYVDDTLASPDMLDDRAGVIRHAYDILDTFAVGKIEVDDIDVLAAGIDTFRLAGFSVTEMAADRIGEFAIEGLTSEVKGEGYVDLGRFALRGLVFPDREAAIATAMGTDDAPPPLPRLGGLEIAGLEVHSGRIPRTRLDSLRLDLSDYVGRVPSAIGLEISGAKVPARIVFDDRARKLLDELGYDEVDADLGFRARWDPKAGTVAVDRLHFAMRDLGTLDGEARFDGLDAGVADDPAALDQALKTMEFAGGSMTFRDDSIVTRGLAMQAKRLQVETDVFREQIAGALPFMLSFVGTPEFQKKIVPVLQTFLRTPGEVTVTAAPDRPVALGELEKLARSAPQTLPALLSVDLTGKAGDEAKTDEPLRRSLDP